MPELTRNGCRIVFDDIGNGPPMVLVHGWCCDRSFMAPQQRHFAATRRIIAPDLPGHGESDKPQREYSIRALADDVLWLCQQLALDAPVVVGHSMGGAIALELAARPDVVSAAVVLDTSVAPTPAVEQGWARLIEGLRDPAYRDVARQAIEQVFFLPSDDAARRERLVASMLAAPQHVMLGGMQGIAGWDSRGAATAARTPLLNISSSAPRADVAAFRALCPAMLHGQVVGSGHFLQLEVPDQVNAMIERFLALLSRRDGGAEQRRQA